MRPTGQRIQIPVLSLSQSVFTVPLQSRRDLSFTLRSSLLWTYRGLVRTEEEGGSPHPLMCPKNKNSCADHYSPVSHKPPHHHPKPPTDLSTTLETLKDGTSGRRRLSVSLFPFRIHKWGEGVSVVNVFVSYQISLFSTRMLLFTILHLSFSRHFH